MFLFSDITESIELNNLRELNIYKDRLLASVTHDIKTPLNNSISYLRLALEEKNDITKIKEFVRKCLLNSDLLLYLLHDILDFSQIHN
jgi:signal transduction histidine kinase